MQKVTTDAYFGRGTHRFFLGEKKHFNSDCVVLIGCELTKGIHFGLSTFLQYTTNTKMFMVTFLKALMGEITCTRILELTHVQ